MRKKLFFAFSLLILTTSLFALPEAKEKLYTKEDKLYRDVEDVLILSGTISPNRYPITGKELLSYLERVPEGKRDELWQSAYKRLTGKAYLIGDKSSGFNLGIEANLAAYPALGNDVPAQFGEKYKDIPSWGAINAEGVFSGNTYLYMRFEEKDPVDNGKAAKSNIETFTEGKNTQAYQPFKAGLSLGAGNLNFQIGRNRLSVGNGMTGNLIVGDNFAFQEYMSVTWFSSFVSYSYSLTHFDQQTGAGKDKSDYTFLDFAFGGNHNNRVMHSLSVHIANRVTLTANLGALFQMDAPFDFRLLNPMMIVHNYNNFSEETTVSSGDEANNIMGLDLMVSLPHGWQINASAAMDQIQMQYETNRTIPNAFAFMLNAKNRTKLKRGILSTYAEAVYTMPYMYLNNKNDIDDKKTTPNYNYDFIVGYGLTGGADFGISGYAYGSDSFVLSTGAEYREDRWSIGVDALYFAHGEHGLFTDNLTFDGYKEGDNQTPFSGTTQHYFKVSVDGEYEILDGLTMELGVAANIIWNYNNAKDEDLFYLSGRFVLSYVWSPAFLRE